MQDDAIRRIETAVNNKLLAYLKQRVPESVFGMNPQGELTVDGLDVGLIRTEEAMYTDETVAGHWRRLKNGRWKWIEEHTRAKKMPTAMELAEIESQEEKSPKLGFDLDAIVQDFIQTLTMPNSLQSELN